MWMDAENKVGELSEKKRWMDGEWSHNSSLREREREGGREWERVCVRKCVPDIAARARAAAAAAGRKCSAMARHGGTYSAYRFLSNTFAFFSSTGFFGFAAFVAFALPAVPTPPAFFVATEALIPLDRPAITGFWFRWF